MKVSVLQWNVWYQEKADNILRLLCEVDADIVCLQELTEDSAFNPGRNIPAEIRSLGYHSHYITTLVREGEDFIRMGNGIFSKFPLASERSVYVQQAATGPEIVDKENRIYIEAACAAPKAIVTVGTAHLSYTRGFIESPAKDRETKLLLDAIGASPQHYVFACDANATPGSSTVYKLSELLNNTGPDNSCATWSTKRHEFTNITIDSLDWRLDFIFASPDLRVLSSCLVDTPYSDHLPVMAVLQV